MRRRIGAEEEFWISSGRRFEDRPAMRFALEYRQTVAMGTKTAREKRVARIRKMLRRDGRADVRGRGGDEFDAFASRHVLEHELERRKVAHDARKRLVDEHALSEIGRASCREGV